MDEEYVRHKDNRLATICRRPAVTERHASRIRETFVSDDKQFGWKKSQTVDEIFDGVDRVGNRGKPRGDGMRYLGSIPIIVAQIWSKQIGAPVGSREFNKYARAQLYDGEFSKLKVNFR